MKTWLGIFFFFIRYERFIERDENYILEKKNTPSYIVLFTSINKTQGTRQKIKATPETIHKRPFSKIVGSFISYSIDLVEGPGGMLRRKKTNLR
jgi:hypothetical protein